MESSSPSHIKCSLTRVPRPIICLNSVIEPIVLSSTIILHVSASTPVLINLDVTAITGYLEFGSTKLSNCALPISLSPVICIMYLESSTTRSAFKFSSLLTVSRACSIDSQNTIVLAYLQSFTFINSVIRAATVCRLSSTIIFLSNSSCVYVLSSTGSPSISNFPASGV